MFPLRFFKCVLDKRDAFRFIYSFIHSFTEFLKRGQIGRVIDEGDPGRAENRDCRLLCLR